jgi:hypothetical protein
MQHHRITDTLALNKTILALRLFLSKHLRRQANRRGTETAKGALKLSRRNLSCQGGTEAVKEALKLSMRNLSCQEGTEAVKDALQLSMRHWHCY